MKHLLLLSCIFAISKLYAVHSTFNGYPGDNSRKLVEVFCSAQQRGDCPIKTPSPITHRNDIFVDWSQLRSVSPNDHPVPTPSPKNK